MNEAMKATLQQLGIPAREIKVMGRTILITTKGETSARKWADALTNFSTILGISEGYDDAKVNRGTVLKPSLVPVWRVMAQIQ